MRTATIAVLFNRIYLHRLNDDHVLVSIDLRRLAARTFHYAVKVIFPAVQARELVHDPPFLPGSEACVPDFLLAAENVFDFHIIIMYVSRAYWCPETIVKQLG
jgi:hypothetical protein